LITNVPSAIMQTTKGLKVTVNSYVLNHSHPKNPQSKCIGNPQLILPTQVEEYISQLSNIERLHSEDGTLERATGDFQDKFFTIDAIREDDDALSHWDRISMNPSHENYRMDIEVDWGKQPEFVKTSPETIESLANEQGRSMLKIEVYSFINDSLIINVKIDEEGVISGYDLGTNFKYTFTPID
jgi:hypothetical protein